MSINIRPFKNALKPLSLKSPALEYLDMLLDSSSDLIFNNTQLDAVENELIYQAINASLHRECKEPACKVNEIIKNLLRLTQTPHITLGNRQYILHSFILNYLLFKYFFVTSTGTRTWYKHLSQADGV